METFNLKIKQVKTTSVFVDKAQQMGLGAAKLQGWRKKHSLKKHTTAKTVTGVTLEK